ncbi:MAG TPA: PilZ domain-containing protein [Roseiarcus sp.]|nr:PilZ domain-containing protein [Roseiarcus sp.]
MQEYAGVKAAAAFAIDAGRHERRRHQRVKVRLTGQFMRQDRREFPCATIDVSPGGIAFEAEASGEIGERIIAYLNQIGRVEGTVARHFYGGFAIQMKLPPLKREKLADQLTWLANRQVLGMPEDRRHERIAPRDRNTTLTLPGGREHLARIIDVSRSGAALAIDVTPPIGTPVTVGSRPAQVVRQFNGGLAVEFNRLIPAEMFDDDIRL